MDKEFCLIFLLFFFILYKYSEHLNKYIYIKKINKNEKTNLNIYKLINEKKPSFIKNNNNDLIDLNQNIFIRSKNDCIVSINNKTKNLNNILLKANNNISLNKNIINDKSKNNKYNIYVENIYNNKLEIFKTKNIDNTFIYNNNKFIINEHELEYLFEEQIKNFTRKKDSEGFKLNKIYKLKYNNSYNINNIITYKLEIEYKKYSKLLFITSNKKKLYNIINLIEFNYKITNFNLINDIIGFEYQSDTDEKLFFIESILNIDNGSFFIPPLIIEYI